jgi:hypothetical protein
MGPDRGQKAVETPTVHTAIDNLAGLYRPEAGPDHALPCALVMADEGARFHRPRRPDCTDKIALLCDVSVFRALIVEPLAKVPIQTAFGV